MKSSDIVAGAVYVNGGAGRTTRKVIAIGEEHAPTEWLGNPENEPTEKIGVLYEQDGTRRTLYLTMFAAWAGRRIR